MGTIIKFLRQQTATPGKCQGLQEKKMLIRQMFFVYISENKHCSNYKLAKHL